MKELLKALRCKRSSIASNRKTSETDACLNCRYMEETTTRLSSKELKPCITVKCAVEQIMEDAAGFIERQTNGD